MRRLSRAARRPDLTMSCCGVSSFDATLAGRTTIVGTTRDKRTRTKHANELHREMRGRRRQNHRIM